MPDIVIGNSASYDGNTANAAEIASALGSNYASASSGALTLKNGVTWNNSDANNPKVSRDGTIPLAMVEGADITSNTSTQVVLNAQGLFVTEVTVASGVYLYSDAQNTPIIIANVPCTITNSGYILGRGANGSTSTAGGNAIEINSSGVTVTNNSGAYIAGGGGGGAVGRNGGGGGGAGGGNGGNTAGGAGGGPGSSGSNGSGTQGGNGTGGGSGGGGAGSTFYGTGGGGGGGRILPGTGGSGGGGYGSGGAGGSGTGAGGSGGFGGNDPGGSRYGCGGGGGWAASGGSSYSHTNVFRAGGVGGKAIEDNGNTYTLTNNGTVYGAT